MVNWMKNIPDFLPVSEINIPGTHDSCTKRVCFSYFSKCQDKTITEQLKSGIRFLDIRVEKEGERLKLVHGISDCLNPLSHKGKLYLDDVVKSCENFLSENSTETILLCFKRDDGASSEEAFDTFFKSYFTNDNLWYKENRVPLMKEARGKIVLLNRCSINAENDNYNDFNAGVNLSNWPYQKDTVKNLFEKACILGRDGTVSAESYCVQDYYGLSPSKKWNCVVANLLENPPENEGVFFNFLSCTKGLYNPKRCAGYINKKLKSITLESKKKYGWIIMDYPTEEFIKQIISSNFS